MTNDLTALAERVEALAGPCRETDADIVEAITGKCAHRHLMTVMGDGDCQGEVCSRCFEEEPEVRIPRFTASLDAAMTLVPEGWLVQDIHQRNCTPPNWSWRAELWSPNADANVRGIARNAGNGIDAAALALTAAALRARSEQPR